MSMDMFVVGDAVVVENGCGDDGEDRQRNGGGMAREKGGGARREVSQGSHFRRSEQ